MNQNPYEAPQAPVADYIDIASDAHEYAGEPRALPAGRGLEWFKKGWALFAQSPGLWIGIYLVFFGILIFAALVPLVGSLAQTLLFPVFMAGFAVGCDALRRGLPLEFNHLFAGFSRNSGQLFLLGGLYLVAVILVLIVAMVPTIGLMGGMAFVGAGDPNDLIATLGMPLLIGMLIYLALLMPLLMAIWFAPALVILNDTPAVDAMKASFRGCLRNIVPFLVYGLVGLVLGIVATIPLLLGWLVLAPLMMTTNYVAYREIFYND